jgi:hypothetical protein
MYSFNSLRDQLEGNGVCVKDKGKHVSMYTSDTDLYLGSIHLSSQDERSAFIEKVRRHKLAVDEVTRHPLRLDGDPRLRRVAYDKWSLPVYLLPVTCGSMVLNCVECTCDEWTKPLSVHRVARDKALFLFSSQYVSCLLGMAYEHHSAEQALIVLSVSSEGDK